MYAKGEDFMRKLATVGWKIITLLCFLHFVGQATSEEQSLTKDPMIISVGWSSPDIRYLNRHIAEWEKRPFTGSVLNVSWPLIEEGSVEMASGKGNAGWHVFGRDRFSREMVRDNVADLHKTNFTSNVDNFLWTVSWIPDGSHFDWFDDEWWATVLHNIELYSRLARQGGLRGLCLDFEEYGLAFWSYGGERKNFALKNKETYRGKSWETVRDQCYHRGHDSKDRVQIHDPVHQALAAVHSSPIRQALQQLAAKPHFPE